MERSHGHRFKRVLDDIAAKIPGINSIHHKRSDDGRILLQFNESGYIDPFYQADMSDGSLKMFAYLLLLEDPDPAPLIGIEEPENGLHHQLLAPFAAAIQSYVRERKGPQVLLTTHSPYLVDALRPEEVWVLQKNPAGFTEVRRSADIEGISDLFDTGLPLGSLWYSNHFGIGNP
jgi:predicted ATPase